MSRSRAPNTPSPMYLSRVHRRWYSAPYFRFEHSKNVPIFTVLGGADKNRQGGESEAHAIVRLIYLSISGR